MQDQNDQIILITGGTGCIGAVTIYQLLKNSSVKRIVVASRSNNTDNLKLWLGEQAEARISFISLDISDYQAVDRMLREVNPTHIIHLGAYQSPDCATYHFQGMDINVGGTMALFDAAEKLPGLQRMVFASSAAVYGMRSMYPQSIIEEDAALAPPNHYGIWKLAGEHLARLFFDNTNVPTVCLRLNTTYGKGRDKGKTSAPTAALKAVSYGSAYNSVHPYSMPYQGRENYHFVEDVGAHFAASTLQPFNGYGVFNIKGETIPVADFLRTISTVAKELGMESHTDLSIADDAPPNLFVSDLSHEKIDAAFEGLPLTSIREGIKKSLLDFRKMAENGILNLAEISHS